MTNISTESRAKRLMGTAMDYWVGFCLGWIWFTDTSFWKILGFEILGLLIIFALGMLLEIILKGR